MRSKIALIVAIVGFASMLQTAGFGAAQGPRGEVIPAGPHIPQRSGAVLFPPVAPGPPQADITVTVNDANVSNNGGPQNETSIAVDPRANGIVVGGANDYGFDGDVSCGFYRSTDDGQNWTRSRVPQSLFPDATRAQGDPSVGVDGGGQVYYGCLAFDRDNVNNGVYVAKSADGVNFTAVPVATSSVIEVFHDKPYIAVDRRTSDSGAGNVYVSWTRFLYEVQFPFLVFKEARIYFSRCSGNPLVCTSPQPLSGPSTQGSVPSVGPNGEVYVAWLKYPEFSGDDFDILVKKSTDQGATFGSAVTAVNGLVPIPDPLPNGSYRVNSFPSIAVGPDGAVYVVYAADPPGSDPADIFLVKSSDGGTSWSSFRVNNDATPNAQFFPWVSVAPGGEVHVAFYDRRDDSGDTAIHLYAASSSNVSAGFTNVRVSDNAFTPNSNDQFGGKFIGDYNGVASGSILPFWTTLVVRSQGRGPRVQDYEVLFDRASTAPPPTGSAPVVTACSPSAASPGAQLTVTVTGLDFRAGATADFGQRVTVQSVTFVGTTRLDVQIKVHPRADPGPRTVTVTNSDGQRGSQEGCFTVN